MGPPKKDVSTHSGGNIHESGLSFSLVPNDLTEVNRANKNILSQPIKCLQSKEEEAPSANKVQPTPSQPKKRKRRNKRKQKNQNQLVQQSVDSKQNEHISVDENDQLYVSQHLGDEADQVAKSQNSELKISIVEGLLPEDSQVPSSDLVSPATPEHGLSPRRQSIMRYKKSSDGLQVGDNYIMAARDNLKGKGSVMHTSERTEEPKVPSQKDLNMNSRVTLFKYKSSKILVYDEQLNDPPSSSGRLLGHGEFEIFQLHNGDVTYLSCGPSFIYPLLPKIKILRVSFNQLILPLVNPERYWKIFINSDEPNVIEVLERTLIGIVHYRNLYYGSSKVKEDSKNDKNVNSTLPLNSYGDNQPLKENERKIVSNHLFSEISNNIPDSPPSAPLSPNAIQYTDTIAESPLKSQNAVHHWPLTRKVSNQSISSAMASFELSNVASNSSRNPQLSTNLLLQPFPQRSHNHPRCESKLINQDQKSESSMDSLLEEYEENASVTKSITFTRSRPPSRTRSIATSFRNPGNYARALNSSTLDEKFSNDSEEFPKTSLSEYNRIHNRGRQKSITSTRSGLHVSDGHWAEKRLPKSQSNYSLASSLYQGTDLSNTYKSIYKSIAQRNSASAMDDSKSVNYQRLPTIHSSTRNLKAASLYLSDNRENYKSSTSMYNGKTSRLPNKDSKGLDSLNLKSLDVFKLVTSHSHNIDEANDINLNTPKKNGNSNFASRLFGW
ncbi:uncharacterized protein PRCAT00003725001 [Priceomyces carsonii]|uniref:uncharacterized protein n=1 Tax=Priceomyces carsonii TaxID=28549 RepID=UPI002ED7FE45|nr:unnamed protein product [Priceomyces carsonii]